MQVHIIPVMICIWALGNKVDRDDDHYSTRQPWPVTDSMGKSPANIQPDQLIILLLLSASYETSFWEVGTSGSLTQVMNGPQLVMATCLQDYGTIVSQSGHEGFHFNQGYHQIRALKEGHFSDMKLYIQRSLRHSRHHRCVMYCTPPWALFYLMAQSSVRILLHFLIYTPRAVTLLCFLLHTIKHTSSQLQHQ